MSMEKDTVVQAVDKAVNGPAAMILVVTFAILSLMATVAVVDTMKKLTNAAVIYIEAKAKAAGSK